MSTRRRKAGLYVVTRRELSIDEWSNRGQTLAPNSQTALAQWFDSVQEWCRDIRRTRPRTSHAQLAGLILRELPFVRGLVERVNANEDRHFAVLEAMRFARAVRDLEHNLVLLPTIESRRAKVQQLADARRLRRPKYTRADYDREQPQSRGKKEALAKALGVTPKTLRKHGRPQQ